MTGSTKNLMNDIVTSMLAKIKAWEPQGACLELADAYYELAMAYAGLMQFELSQQYLSKAESMCENLAPGGILMGDILCQKALVAADQGDYPAAICMAQRAVELGVKILESEGIQALFGISGAAINPVYEYLGVSLQIKHYLERHEEGAVHAADGYFRACGQMALAICTSGPGATKFVTGLYTAQADSFPLIAITGQIEIGEVIPRFQNHLTPDVPSRLGIAERRA